MRARPLDGRAFAAIQQTELDPRLVRQAAHDAVQRVDLADKVALAKTADSRIAGHGAQCLDPQRDKSSRHTHPGGCCCRFGARMAAADHDDIVVFHVEHPLLADAETGENLAEEVVDINAADKSIKRPHGLSQMLRRQFDARVIPYHFRT